MGDSLTAADILNQAADHIEKYGWLQDGWHWPLNDDGESTDPMECAVCASAAINVAAGFAPDYEPDGTEGALNAALNAFAGRVRSVFRPSWDDALAIAAWNDTYGRTSEQVVAELRACAADLRGGAS
jgi:hypothetical protein